MKAEADWTALRDTLGKAKLVYWSVGTEDAGYPDSKVVWDLFKARISPSRPSRVPAITMGRVAAEPSRLRSKNLSVSARDPWPPPEKEHDGAALSRRGHWTAPISAAEE